jgi:hypothetical protein
MLLHSVFALTIITHQPHHHHQALKQDAQPHQPHQPTAKISMKQSELQVGIASIQAA